jgi:hypothetical protein
MCWTPKVAPPAAHSHLPEHNLPQRGLRRPPKAFELLPEAELRSSRAVNIPSRCVGKRSHNGLVADKSACATLPGRRRPLETPGSSGRRGTTMNGHSSRKMLRTPEAAFYCGSSPSTLRNYASSEAVPASSSWVEGSSMIQRTSMPGSHRTVVPPLRRCVTMENRHSFQTRADNDGFNQEEAAESNDGGNANPHQREDDGANANPPHGPADDLATDDEV